MEERRKRPSSIFRLGLPGLLWKLAREQQTGVLKLEDGTGSPPAQVHLVGGRITYVAPLAPIDGLGPMLLRAGVITNDQYARALRRLTDELVEQEEVSLAALLVEHGFATVDQVEGALHLAIRSRMLGLFGRGGVRAAFRAGEAEDLGGRFSIDPAALFLDGVERHFDPARLEEALVPVTVQYVSASIRSPVLARLALDARRYAFVATLDGTRTGAEVLAACPLGRQTGVALCYVLHAVGVLEASPVAAVPEAAPLPPPPEAAVARSRAVTMPLRAPPEGRSEVDVLAAYRPAPGTNHYVSLGLRSDATPRQIELAFRSLSQPHRPDRDDDGAARSPLHRHRAATMWAQLVYAYETLRDPRRRQAYDAIALSGSRAGVELTAEESFRRGREVLDERPLEAAACFALAWALAPSRADYACHEVWALVQHARDAGEDADAATRDGLAHMMEVVRVHGETPAALAIIETARRALDDSVPDAPIGFPEGSGKHATVVERPVAAMRRARNPRETMPARLGARGARPRPRTLR